MPPNTCDWGAGSVSTSLRTAATAHDDLEGLFLSTGRAAARDGRRDQAGERHAPMTHKGARGAMLNQDAFCLLLPARREGLSLADCRGAAG